jgi:magnesium transporter
MKVFTLVSLLLMPPTLIASIYGMNIKLPGMENGGAFWWLVGVMVVSIGVTVVVFKKRKML